MAETTGGNSSAGGSSSAGGGDLFDEFGAQNTEGLQSFEITLSEQQLTDQVRIVGTSAIGATDIMTPVKHHYLDYICDMRVERVQQTGILFSCECCSNIDDLLYTQIDYKIPPNTEWYTQSTVIEKEKEYPAASEHVEKIASALNLQPVMQFDDFLSTVIMDEKGGSTYNDLIRDIFGWTARIPTQLINIYIRDGKLYVIQRGKEGKTVDLSDADKTTPSFTRELVRMTYGSTPWSKTETREVKVSKPNNTSDTGGDDSGSGDDDEKENYNAGKDEFDNADSYGTVKYYYNSNGLLKEVDTHTVSKSTNKTTDSTIKHSYDSDNLLTKTETSTTTTDNGKTSSTRTVDERAYRTLSNGEKFLSRESTEKYEDEILVDYSETFHSPTRVGQKHALKIDGDGDIAGEISGQDTGDDRVTPYSNYKADELKDQKKESEETDKEKQTRTVNGLSLYDSSFPVHGEDKLKEITNAIKNLNRKTQETATLTVYGLKHVIDFNDKITLDGKEYFLVSNTARTTPRIFNEQNLTLRRWY